MAAVGDRVQLQETRLGDRLVGRGPRSDGLHVRLARRQLGERHVDVVVHVGDEIRNARDLKNIDAVLNEGVALTVVGPEVPLVAGVVAPLAWGATLHLALAEAYALKGALPAALDQLQIARRASDASFYDQSIIDAREREFQERRREDDRRRDGVQIRGHPT